MRFLHRIWIQLILVLSVVALTPALITGFYAIHVSSATLLTEALSTQLERTKATKQYIETTLGTAKRDLLFLSQSIPLKSYFDLLKEKTSQNNELKTGLEQSYLMLEEEFSAFFSTHDTYYQALVIDKTGREVVHIENNGEKMTLLPREKLQNRADRIYFKETMNLPRTLIYVSPLQLSRKNGQIEEPYKPIIRYGIKLFDQNQMKVGAIVISLDVNQFFNSLDSSMRLASQEGYFIYHSNENKRWGNENDLGNGYNLEKEYGDLIDQLIGLEGVISTDRVLLAYQRINIPESIRYLTLIIQRDTREVLKEVTVFRITFGVVLIVSVMIALMFGLLFSMRITVPLNHLTLAANALGRGEYLETPIEVDNEGEIGQLADAINKVRLIQNRLYEEG